MFRCPFPSIWTKSTKAIKNPNPNVQWYVYILAQFFIKKKQRLSLVFSYSRKVNMSISQEWTEV